jgi:O-antigen/teichoic acid export membrane protein
VPIDQVQTLEPPAGPDLGLPSGSLRLSVFRNAAAHLAGRNLISLGRLVAASTIARTYGREVFGQYSLIIVILAIAEWLLDFGTSDVFVREICRAPERGARLLRMLAGLKILQFVVACAGFLLLMVSLRYPVEMLHASFFAAGSLLFFGGTLIYHTLFKATLTIEREVLAELGSVVLMIALLKIAPRFGVTVAVIFACHMASRAVFFLLCYLFGRRRFKLSLEGVKWPDIRWSFGSSAAIGAIGLIVVVYESIDLLLLSRIGSLSDVAYYSGAQRFVSPVVIALTGIGSTLYPLAASYWPDAWSEFEQSCQRALDSVFVVAGLAICTLVSGSDFLMSLLGKDLAAGAGILRVLALVLFMKAVTNALGPVLYVVQAQNRALWMVAGALVVKATLILLLAPRFGYIGVALSAILTDSATAFVTIRLLRKASGFRVRWKTPVQLTAIGLAAAYAPRLLHAGNGILAPMVAAALFVPLVFLSGAVRFSDLRLLLAWKRA